MKCYKCNADIKEGSKFCRHCGARVGEEAPERTKQYCPECGAECDPDDVFCGECGASLQEEEADVFASLDAAIDADYRKQAFEPFEYEDHRDGTYTVTGLKDKSVRRLAVPEGVVEITSDAFAGCKFTVVTLPSTLTRIGDSAFKECRELREINLPDGLEYLGSYAFYYCVKLEKVRIPRSLKEIQYCTFDNCTSLRIAELHDDIQTIGNYAFSECNALEAVHIPAKLKVLSDSAFALCYELKEVKLPSGMVSVGYYAFRDCMSLRRIVLPASITNIGYNSFARVGEAEVVYEGTVAQWKRISLDSHWHTWYRHTVRCKDGVVELKGY